MTLSEPIELRSEAGNDTLPNRRMSVHALQKLVWSLVGLLLGLFEDLWNDFD